MAVYDEPTLCNLALSKIGISQRITDINEINDRAKACRLWYNPTRDLMLAKFAWMMASRKIAMGLVETDPDDGDGEWKYSYRYPTTCIVARRVVSPIMGLPSTEGVPFKVGGDASGRLIFTNQAEAVLECTVVREDEAEWGDAFAQAFATVLASNICNELTVDPGQVADIKREAANVLRDAKGVANQEQHRHAVPASTLITSRFS